MTPADRLKEARIAAGFSSASEFAKKVGVSPSTYGAYENGGRDLTIRAAREFARPLGTTWDWLFHGTNPVAVTKITEIDIQAAAGGGRLEDDENKRTVQWQVPTDFLRRATTSIPEALRIISVIGDSMAPLFETTDKVIIDTAQRTPSPPGVFVLWDGMGFVLKRISYIADTDPPKIKITSDNVKYDPYERVADEVHIQGRVIGKWLWI